MTSVISECDSVNSDEEAEYLDPRIQIELERLNTCTDEINKLETELDEANTTFRMLLNESMRRLKVLTWKLGSCIDRARPYYEAVDIARKAQAECQRAAVKFQRANEIHQAAKETVALAETRFLSNQHEWQFDSAWQEMLNHAIIKVTEAEHQRTESGQEHQKRATLFNVAEQRVAILEQKLKRTIIKSRPYFEEKALCQEQLDTQKRRVEELQAMISKVKSEYSGSLKRLEAISEEIHQRRRNKSGSASPLPRGPREPGVGAELAPEHHEEIKPAIATNLTYSPELKKCGNSFKWSGEDLENELEKFEVGSLGSASVHTSSHVSESEDFDDEDLDELRQKVKELSMAEVRSDTWETELAQNILRLDNAMLERECNRELRAIALKPCGSPLKEQECNRELTAIVSTKTEEDTENEGISNDENPETSSKSSEDSSKELGMPCSKSLEIVLAEEESKREEKLVISAPASAINKSVHNSDFPAPIHLQNASLIPLKMEELSAVALNQLVSEKEVNLSKHNTPKKSLNPISTIKNTTLELNTSNLETNNNENKLNYNKERLVENSSDIGKNESKVNLNQDIGSSPSLYNKSVKIEHDSSLIKDNPELNLNLEVDRKQSIGAAASKLLNSAKIESLRVNLNENILHTIKDVSESVLNRLVRQDSKESNNAKLDLTVVHSSNQAFSINNPFKNREKTVENNVDKQESSVQPNLLNPTSVEAAYRTNNDTQSIESHFIESNSTLKISDNNQSVNNTLIDLK